MKIVFIILTTLLLLLFSSRLFRSWLNNNTGVPEYSLSREESRLIYQLSTDCKCEVSMQHSYALMKRNKENVSWKEIMANGFPRNDTALNNQDYTLFLCLSWRTGEKYTATYHQRDDICGMDSITRYKYATKIVNALLQASENIKYYRCVRINFSTFESFGDETGNSHICDKDIYIRL